MDIEKERLEPMGEHKNISPEAAACLMLYSIAISLKRIADTQEAREKRQAEYWAKRESGNPDIKF